MNRPLLFLAAAASAAIAVSSACLAEVGSTTRPFRADDLHFTLIPAKRAGAMNFQLREDSHHNSYANTVAPNELGLAPEALDRDGPLKLAMAREPGRIDCTGEVRDHRAEGACRFTPDAAFNTLLAQAGIAQPKAEDSYGMAIVGVTRALVEAVRDAHYGPAKADDLTAMAAVGVSPSYIRDLASRGYRPANIEDLVAFKAVGVTPSYVDGLMKAGMNLDHGENIVAMRALNITPEFVAGFARIGYADLDPDQLLQLKALGVTPAMVQAIERDRTALSLPQREAARTLVERRRR